MRFFTNLFAFTTLLILISCIKKEEKKEVVLRPVNYMIVGNSNGEEVRVFSGRANAADEIELSFRSAGIISEMNMNTGQTVKKGDLLARLDNVEARLAYEKAVSALKAAESSMNTSKSELDRVKALYQKQAVALGDYQTAKNAYQTALDQYESAIRNKSIQKTQVNYGYIYAPSDGIIAEKNSGLNENVSSGQVIAVLNAGDKINIEVGIPENIINKVELGMNTIITFSAIKANFSGDVIEVAPIIASGSATFPVKININNPVAAIRPGMAANISFDFSKADSETDGTLIIPIKTVGEDGQGNYVFVIESEDNQVGVARKTHIKVGELAGGGFTILGGLTQGQKIATAGLQTLLDGQEVRLQ